MAHAYVLGILLVSAASGSETVSGADLDQTASAPSPAEGGVAPRAPGGVRGGGGANLRLIEGAKLDRTRFERKLALPPPRLAAAPVVEEPIEEPSALSWTSVDPKPPSAEAAALIERAKWRQSLTRGGGTLAGLGASVFAASLAMESDAPALLGGGLTAVVLGGSAILYGLLAQPVEPEKLEDLPTRRDNARLARLRPPELRWHDGR